MNIKEMFALTIKKLDICNDVLITTGAVNMGMIGLFGQDVIYTILSSNPTLFHIVCIWIGYAGIKKAFSLYFHATRMK
jgi:uncharacterized membrane protein YuzA (DUF378 family)